MVANFGIPQCFQKWQLPASSSKFPNLATFELPKNCHIWLQVSMLIVGTLCLILVSMLVTVVGTLCPILVSMLVVGTWYQCL